MPASLPIALVTWSLLQAGAPATPAAAPRPERSHVERFANPRDRAARDEVDATARLRANASDVEALSERGTARVLLRKLDGALADFRRASELAPQQPDLLVSCGYVLTLLNRGKEAENYFGRAIAIDPENFYANYHYGRLLLVAGRDLRRAASFLERAITLRPDVSDIRFDLLTVYRQLGELELAGAQLRYLRDQRPRDPRVVYADGLLAVDRGDFATAIARFEDALRAEPRLRGARQDLALAYVRAGRWADAEPLLAALSAETPSAPEPAYLHALALFNMGRTVDAEVEVRRLVAALADNVAVQILFGVVRSANGAPPAELVDIFKRAVALDPKSFDGQLYLGRALYGARQRPAAIAAFSEAVRLDPNHLQARFFLATALEDEGQTDDAAAQYEELARRAPDSPEGHLGLGAVLIKRGQLDDAIKELARAVELNPNLFEAHYALGRALLRAGRAEEAVASLERATTLDPSRTEGHYQLALALRKAGREDSAAREFETVERLNEAFRTNSEGMGAPAPQD